MSKIPFRTAYGERFRVPFSTDPRSLTHQSEAAACDINAIMAKYEKTGILEHRNTFSGQYGDFTDLPQDYHASMNAVLEAREMFDTLPAAVRRRFSNGPGVFLDFVADKSNGDELVRMGLAEARDLVEPISDPKKSASVPMGGEKAAEAPSKAETKPE